MNQNRFNNNNQFIGQNFPLPGMAQPQVFAQNLSCDQPNISIFQQPPCNDPRTSVQVTKRVFETVISELFIWDNGTQIGVGFGAASAGRNPNNATPTAETVTVDTDSTSDAIIRDITLSIDGYAEDSGDPRADADLNFGVFNGEVGRSFTECLTALLAGNIVVDNVPFPTVIPIASAIKTVGGYDVHWDLGGITTDTSFFTSATTLATVNIFRYAISPALISTHAHAPAPIEIYLPPSSSFPVRLEVLNRVISPDNVAYANSIIYVWTGMMTILLEKKTSLGTLPVYQGGAPAPMPTM